MKTVIITDGKYRSSLAAAREFGKAGYEVIVTQTESDTKSVPPVFYSAYASGVTIEGSVKDEDYAEKLKKIISKYDNPVLFCTGAATLKKVSLEKDEFGKICSFLVSDSDKLDFLNDKEKVRERAKTLNIPVPEEYSGVPDGFPVVIKPHCGESFGLKASERYAIAHNPEEYNSVIEKMKKYDPSPIVQKKVAGDGFGVSVLMDGDSNPVKVICHRRIREYPISGGPSTCCITDYDENKVEYAVSLLKSVSFTGLAMVEFKGDCLLEVNPRVWGTFPLTVFAKAGFCVAYAKASLGEQTDGKVDSYERGVKMRFCINDLAASASLILGGKPGRGFSGLADYFRVPEALKDKTDMKAYRKYIRSYL